MSLRIVDSKLVYYYESKYISATERYILRTCSNGHADSFMSGCPDDPDFSSFRQRMKLQQKILVSITGIALAIDFLYIIAQ